MLAAVCLLVMADGYWPVDGQVAATASASSLTRVIHTRYGRMQGVIVEASGAKINSNSNGHHSRRASIEMFLGVPYAMPPTGPNRFSPTRALTPWDGIKLFDRFGPVCPQWLPDIRNETEALRRMPRGRLEQLKRLLPYLGNQSEDCLYLNIYAPAAGEEGGATSQKYPVMVYFHGESYSWNSGNVYDGRTLASYASSIVVTFNYRLGVLGFLNMNSEPFQKARVANFGLMDQIAALHWIQQNIGNFHGDPNNITLVGHGTGAACVNFLMISPAVMPGLFQRTILLSGSALSSWALVQEPMLYSLEIARQTNCSQGSAEKQEEADEEARRADGIIDCLRQVPLAWLTTARITAPTFLHTFGPSVDGVVIRADFHRQLLAHSLPQPQTYAKAPPSPLPLLLATHHHNSKKSTATMTITTSSMSTTTSALDRYDLLFGCVTGEALHGFSHEDVQSGFEGERRDRILRTYIRNTYDYHLSEIFYTVVNEYTDWERTVLHPINTRDSTVAALSDAQFVAPLIQTGDAFSHSIGTMRPSAGVTPLSRSHNTNTVFSAKLPAKAYFYVFDYQTKDGDYPQRIGAVHGEDLPYIFGAPLAKLSDHFSRNFTKQETALSEALMTYIGNFARVGNPNEYQKQEPTLSVGKERNRFKETVWEEYDAIHQKYMEISTKPKMKNHFRAHQLSVWLRLIPELHRAGMEDVSLRHNVFHSHTEAGLYDGVVRPDKHQQGGGSGGGGSSSSSGSAPIVQSQASRRSYMLSTRNTSTVAGLVQSMTTLQPLLTTCVNLPSTLVNSATVMAAGSSLVIRSNDDNHTLAEVDAALLPSVPLPHPSTTRGPYTASLAVTVAIGCTLFLLNALIYALVRYQGDKTHSHFTGFPKQQTQPELSKQQQQQQQHQLQQQQRQQPEQPLAQQPKHRLEYAATSNLLPCSPFGSEVAIGCPSSNLPLEPNEDATLLAVANGAPTTFPQLAYNGRCFEEANQTQCKGRGNSPNSLIRMPIVHNNSDQQQQPNLHHLYHHRDQHYLIHQQPQLLQAVHQDNSHQQRRHHCHPPQPLLHEYAENAASTSTGTHHYASKEAIGRDDRVLPTNHQRTSILRVPAAAISEMRV